MTALNNFEGTIVQDGQLVYSETLEPSLVFIVVELYKPPYMKDNFGDSAQLKLDTAIVTGERHTWTNGAMSYLDATEIETVPVSMPFAALRELKTSKGYRVWQHGYNEVHFKRDDKDMKSRAVKWLVDVPKSELGKFFV